jgi:glycosyltransferase involved in cell wall biosynthesis
VKLAVVVQRYGTEINGGAELLARSLAERLAKFADVEVLTTCARDYITWRNELPAGRDTVNGITVHRFPVSRPRDPRDFGYRSRWLFGSRHSVRDELRWLDSEGPRSPELIRHIARTQSEFDFFVFVSFRYYHAYHGTRAVPGKAVLIPTAERDPAVALAIFAPIFRGARAVVYLTPEERALIESIVKRTGPSLVAGLGSVVPERADAGRFRRKHNIRRPFAVYVGRIDPNKGCAELFSHFAQYAERYPSGLDLITVGSPTMPVPSHPRMRHLGFVPDDEKFDAIAAADLLIMPSPYESLSIVVLEAWALGKPVLVNGRCDVLRGQVLRSRGGLYYENADEFAEALYFLEATGPGGVMLGRQGREYYRRHYSWPVVDHKFRDLFERLTREKTSPAMEPMPGWFARRRRNVPAAQDVLDAAPAGPVMR